MAYDYYRQGDYHVIQTEAGNIRPRILNKPINTTSQIGINGTFFDDDESEGFPSIGIYWYENHGGDYKPNAPEHTNKTLYGVKSGGTVSANWGFYTDISQLFDDEGGSDNLQWIISGKSLNDQNDYGLGDYSLARRRTAMGFKDTPSRTQIIMMVTDSGSPRNIPDLLDDIQNFGYDASYFIVLDGGTSTTMRVYDGGIQYYGGDGSRSISNMVSLINT